MQSPFDNVEYLLKCDLKTAEFNLGVALQYEFAPPNVRFSAPYAKIGRELWLAIRYEVWGLLCERDQRSAKKWTEELIAGDARDLVVAFATLIASQLDVTLSIAVPAAALLVKRQVHSFCASAPRKPKRSVTEILTAKQGAMAKTGQKIKS
jgi:hypothetical protein